MCLVFVLPSRMLLEVRASFYVHIYRSLYIYITEHRNTYI